MDGSALLGLFVVLLGLLALAWGDVETVKDALEYLVPLSASKKEITYKYQAIDKQATFSIAVYIPNETSSQILTELCLDDQCTRPFFSERGLFSVDMKTYENTDSNEINMVDHPIYIHFYSESGQAVRFWVMSSIILQNEKTITINPKTNSDEYDYEGNNYIRYFRVFACDDDDDDDGNERPNKDIRYLGGGELLDTYINFWKTDKSDEPGRPLKNKCDKYQNIQNFNLKNETGYIYPGWVFLGLDFSRLMNATGLDDQDYNVEITSDLETLPSPMTKESSYETDLCLYNDCYEFTWFNLDDYLKDENGGDVVVDKLTFVAMISQKHNHNTTGFLNLDVMTSTYYEDENDFSLQTSGNVVEFDKEDIDLLKELEVEQIIVAISTIQNYRFPLSIPGGASLNVMSTIVKDATVVRVGGTKATVQLKKANDWGNEDPIYYSRMVVSTVAVNGLEYVDPIDENGNYKDEILCNYYVDVKTSDETDYDAQLSVGAFIGNGYSKVPYYNIDEDGNIIGNNYIFESTLFPKNDTEGIHRDSQIILINSESKHYYQDGAYLLDVIDRNYDKNHPSDLGSKVDVIAVPSWVLKPNEEYTKYITPSRDYDFFTIKTSDIEQGIIVYVELLEAVTYQSDIEIYASFVTPLPTENAAFRKEKKHYTASLNISAQRIKQYANHANNGEYTLYIAVNTVHNGNMRILVTTGSTFKSIVDGEYVDVDLPINGPEYVVRFHSNDTGDYPKLAIGVEIKAENWEDDVNVDTCVDQYETTTYNDCNKAEDSGNSWSFSSKDDPPLNHHTFPITIPSNGNNDYTPFYVHLRALQKTQYTNNGVISARVYGIVYKEAEPNEDFTLTVDEYEDPIMFFFNSSPFYSYKLDISFVGENKIGREYRARICADYPSYSSTDPEDVDQKTFIRACDSDIIHENNPLSINLIRDVIVNNATAYNDENYIRAWDRYVTIYPGDLTAGTKLHVALYEDKLVRANIRDKELETEHLETGYFTLHIINTERKNYKDLLNFSFKGDNVVHYCMSSSIHPSIKGECVMKSTDERSNIEESIPLRQIDRNYANTPDVYLYFAIYFPNSQANDHYTRTTYFTSSINHHMNVSTNGTTNMKEMTYYFEMNYDKVVDFNITEYPDDGFTFVFMPDMDDMSGMDDESKKGNSRSYTTTNVAITSTTDSTIGSVEPTEDNADAIGGGIIMKKYNADEITMESPLEDDESKYISISARFLNSVIDSPLGLYRAGFFDVGKGKALDITTLEFNKFEHYFHDTISNVPDEENTFSKLFYYPKVEQDLSLAVYPCAGIPGVISSFINIQPTDNDKYSRAYPLTDYNKGKPFAVKFFNDITNESIDVPTGYMFNATYSKISYLNIENDRSNARWDAYLRIISNSNSISHAGPVITDPNLEPKQRGAEVQLTFVEALSGYSTDSSVTKTHIEYAMFGIPYPDIEEQAYDATPKTFCGLQRYGFSLTASGDSEKDIIWKRGEHASNADGSMDISDDFNVLFTLISNRQPNKRKEKNGLRINKYDSTSNKYYVNVIAREVKDDAVEGEESVIGYSTYSPIILEISGSLPTTPGGMFGWEIFIIVSVVIIVVGLIVVMAVLCIKRKRREMGYGNLDGHGNTSKHGLNLDLPEDDLSISASSSHSLTPGNALAYDKIHL